MVTHKCGIYKILNIITRDYYLGGSYNINGRWNNHRQLLRKNLHGKNTHFQNAWNKYGEQAFEFSVILLCDREHKLYFEDGFLKLFKPAYNIATNATASFQGLHHTAETRTKMTDAWKTRAPVSEETKRKMSEIKTGHITTEETKHKMSEANTGESGYWYGKHLPEETKHKMSEAHKGGSGYWYGKHRSEETKRKISDACKNRAGRGKLSITIINNKELTIMKTNNASKSRTSEKVTARDISHITGNEGLGYTIMYLLSPERIEDEKLARLVKLAQDTISEIETMLEEAVKDEVGVSHDWQA